MTSGLLALWLAATPAAWMEGLSHGTLAHAQVGEWATYRIGDGALAAAHVRVAVVGRQADAQGRDALWLEIELGEHPSMEHPIAQMKLLAARDEGLTPRGVSRLFVGAGPAPVREVASGDLGKFVPRLSPRLEASGAVPLRVRRGRAKALATAAGTVAAFPMDLLAGEKVVQRIWISREVPILHLARVEIPALRQSMELGGFGTGASAKIPTPGEKEARIRWGAEAER